MDRGLRILVLNDCRDKDQKKAGARLFAALAKGRFNLIFSFATKAPPEPSSKASEADKAAAWQASVAASDAQRQLDSMKAAVKDSGGDVVQMSWTEFVKSRSLELCKGRQCVLVSVGSSEARERLKMVLNDRLSGVLSSSARTLPLPLFVAVFPSADHQAELRTVAMAEVVAERFNGAAACEGKRPFPVTLLLSAQGSKEFAHQDNRSENQTAGDPDIASTSGRSHDDSVWLSASAPLVDLASLFEEHFHRENQSANFAIPSKSGRVNIQRSELAEFTTNLELLHSSSGDEAVFQSVGGGGQGVLEGEAIAKLREHFLQGHDLTVDALRAHDRALETGKGVYAKRSMEAKLSRKLEQTLEQVVERWEKEGEAEGWRQKTLVLRHEPSSGGTTLGRVALWGLKDRWPCAFVHGALDGAQEPVRRVLAHTDRPLLLLVEASAGNSLEDTLRFHGNFHNKHLVILLLQPTDLKDPTRSSAQRASIHQLRLGLQLDENEEHNFRYLHSAFPDKDMEERKDFTELGKAFLADRELDGSRTPFVWGLFSFMDKYNQERVRGFTKAIFDMATGRQREVVFLCAYLRLNGGRHFLGKSIANFFLSLPSKMDDEEALLGALGSARHLVLSTRRLRWQCDCEDWGLRPPTKQAAAAFLHMLGEEQALDPVRLLVALLMRPADDEDGPSIQGALDHLILTFFRYKGLDELPESLETRENKHCKLIRQVFQSYDSVVEACKVMGQLASVASGVTQTHVYAHTARFLIYEFKEAEKQPAIQLILKALDVRKVEDVCLTSCNDHVILCMCAHILYCSMEKPARHASDPAPGGPSQQTVIPDYGLAKQISELCERARMIQERKRHRTCHPLMHQIECLHLVQKGYFGQDCGSDPERYFDSLEKDGNETEAGQRHSRLLRSIVELEHLNQSNELAGNLLRLSDLNRIDWAKSWLRKLYLGFIRRRSHEQLLETELGGMAYAWICVDLILCKVHDDRSSEEKPRMWEMAARLHKALSPRPNDGYSELKAKRLDWERVVDTLRAYSAELLAMNRFELVLLLAMGRMDESDEGRLLQAVKVASEWRMLCLANATPLFLLVALHLARVFQADADDDRDRRVRALRDYGRATVDLHQLVTGPDSARVHGKDTVRFVLECRVEAKGSRHFFLRPVDRLMKDQRSPFAFLLQGTTEREERCEGQPLHGRRTRYKLQSLNVLRLLKHNINHVQEEAGSFKFELGLSFLGLAPVRPKRITEN